jgi:hypothetical protein
MSPLTSAAIGRNWGPCGKVNILFIENLPLMVPMGDGSLAYDVVNRGTTELRSFGFHGGFLLYGVS